MKTFWRWWDDNLDTWIDNVWNWYEGHFGIIEDDLSEDDLDCATEQIWAIKNGLC